ncbi:MAG: hypothetical protein ABJ242_00545 [Marinomonas sp.]
MANSESKTSRWLGWLIAAGFTGQVILLSFLPRVDKFSALREDLRGVHYTLGIILVIALIARIRLWFKEPRLLTETNLSAGQQYFHRGISFTWFAVLLGTGLIGFITAWAEGKTVHILGLIDLPALIGKSHSIWMFAGYFHSASAMVNTLLAWIVLLVGAVCLFRKGTGVLKAFPTGIGAMALASFLTLMYVLNSFQDRSKGYIAFVIACIFVLIVAVIGRWWHSRRKSASSEASQGAPVGAIAKFGSFAVIGSVLGVASYLPYQSYGVVPWAIGEVVEADPNITWHQERVAEVTITAETPFEAEVSKDAYKWCKFCHTMQEGEAHLIGPNLHNIIGQQAGTVPNFAYSKGMAQAGRDGLVWDEETIKAFIANPDKIVPGNRMVVNRGPVTDPKEQDAVINLLKREAMVGKE